MYVQQNVGPVYNIKWDLYPTRWTSGARVAAPAAPRRAELPALPTLLPAPARPAAARPALRRPCPACACKRKTLGCAECGGTCSARGINSARPAPRGLYGLGYNSAANVVYLQSNPAKLRGIADGMIAEGYSPQIINSLVAAGATVEDLQNLWDNYTPSTNAADPDGFGLPALQLMKAIQAQHAPGAGGGSIFEPSGANPIINKAADAAIGVRDTVSSVVADVTSLFSSTPSVGGFSIPLWGWILGGAAVFAVLDR